MREFYAGKDLGASLRSVKLEALAELVAFLNHQSSLAVAQELGISQSTLSKHMAKLERELGFQLFDRHYKLTLTPAGRRFALYSASILEHVMRGVQECSELQATGTRALRIETNDVSFAGQEKFNNVLNHFMTLNESYDFSVVPRHSKDARKALEEGMVDLLLWHEFGTIEEIERLRAAEGIGLIFLSSEHLMVWANKNHRIFSLDTIRAADVARERIMTMSSMGMANRCAVQEELFRTKPYAHFTPKRDFRIAETRAKFLMLDPAGSIYILPESFARSPYVYERTSMKWRVIEDGSSLHHMFLAYNLNSENSCVHEFAAYLRAELA